MSEAVSAANSAFTGIKDAGVGLAKFIKGGLEAVLVAPLKLVGSLSKFASEQVFSIAGGAKRKSRSRRVKRRRSHVRRSTSKSRKIKKSKSKRSRRLQKGVVQK